MAARRGKKPAHLKLKPRGKPGTPPNPIKPGEVRNPKGINGWTKAREAVRDALSRDASDLFVAAVRLAKAGDTQALRLLLGPLLPEIKQKIEAEGEFTVRFARKGETK